MKEPKIRFKEFKGEWETSRLDSCVDFLDNLRKPIEEGNRIKGIYPYYGASGIVDYVNDYIFVEELILLSEDGANITDRNYPVCFLASGKYWVNNHAHVLKAKDGFVNCFVSNAMERKDYSQYNTGMAMPKLNKEVCKNIPLTYPLIEEQQSIASFFTTIDAQISASTSRLASLKQIKAASLQAMFPQEGETVPKLRFKGFEGEWEKVKVGEIFCITRGYVLAMNLVSLTKNGINRYAVYSSQTKNNGLAGYYNNYLFEDCITWTTDGANAGDVNYRAGKFYCTNVCGVLINKEGYANKCIAECLNLVTKHYVSYVGNPKLMNNTMSEIEILIPPIQNEQQKISEYFTNLDRQILLQGQKLEKLKQIKAACLDNMFV